jgi:hypothetical protein
MTLKVFPSLSVSCQAMSLHSVKFTLFLLEVLICICINVQDVEGMMSISTEAAEARASLSDDRELLRTFEVRCWVRRSASTSEDF